PHEERSSLPNQQSFSGMVPPSDCPPRRDGSASSSGRLLDGLASSGRAHFRDDPRKGSTCPGRACLLGTASPFREGPCRAGRPPPTPPSPSPVSGTVTR